MQHPEFLFRAYGMLEFWISTIIHREPTLTPHRIDILCEHVYSDSSAAIKELNCHPSSLQEMLQDCFQWMVSVGILKR